MRPSMIVGYKRFCTSELVLIREAAQQTAVEPAELPATAGTEEPTH